MTRNDVVVGFIGLGIMGGRMAANLMAARLRSPLYRIFSPLKCLLVA